MATTNLSYYDKETIPNAAGLRFGIVVSEWNEEITEGLYKGAHEALIENGVAPEDIIRVNVPGSFELTYGANLLAETTDVDGIITLGSVIQGETKHFDFVCQGATDGIMRVMLDFNTPISFCVLTDNTREQSIARSGGIHGNKGIEAAVSLLQMIETHKTLL